MLSSFLTEDVFKKGLAVSTAPLANLGGFPSAPPRPQPCPVQQGILGAPARPSPQLVSPQSYLQAFEYQNTVYLDLWEHLQQVGDSEAPRSLSVRILSCPKSLGKVHV
jgi:hypothetical protein